MATYVEPKEEIISDEDDSNLILGIPNSLVYNGEQNIDANNIEIQNEVLHYPNDETNKNIRVKTEIKTDDEEEGNSQIFTYEYYNRDEQKYFPEETLQETFSKENPDTTCQSLNQEVPISRESDSSKSNMTENMNENFFGCKTCNKQFASISKLKIHEITHTKKKRVFLCENCGKQFTRKQNLTRHLRIHTGEKPYSCPVCAKTFSETSHIKSHVRIHTGEKPYKCEVCEKQFSAKSTLDGHKRIHTGEKPYKCTQCDMTFTLQKILNDHLRIHTDEKPYACPTCNKSFKHRSSLKAHVETHKNDKLSDEPDVSPSYFSLLIDYFITLFTILFL